MWRKRTESGEEPKWIRSGPVSCTGPANQDFGMHRRCYLCTSWYQAWTGPMCTDERALVVHASSVSLG